MSALSSFNSPKSLNSCQPAHSTRQPVARALPAIKLTIMLLPLRSLLHTAISIFIPISPLHCHYLDCLQGAGPDTVTTALAKRCVCHRYLIGRLLFKKFMSACQGCSTNAAITLFWMAFIVVHQSHLAWHQSFSAFFAFSSSSSKSSSSCTIDACTE